MMMVGVGSTFDNGILRGTVDTVYYSGDVGIAWKVRETGRFFLRGDYTLRHVAEKVTAPKADHWTAVTLIDQAGRPFAPEKLAELVEVAQ
jgi:hypothetical protein